MWYCRPAFYYSAHSTWFIPVYLCTTGAHVSYRKCQDYVYIKWEYRSTMQKIKHQKRRENKVNENKELYCKLLCYYFQSCWRFPSSTTLHVFGICPCLIETPYWVSIIYAWLYSIMWNVYRGKISQQYYSCLLQDGIMICGEYVPNLGANVSRTIVLAQYWVLHGFLIVMYKMGKTIQ